MVSYDTFMVSSILMVPLYVLFPVAREVAVEAESGQNEVESYVTAEPAMGNFIKFKS